MSIQVKRKKVLFFLIPFIILALVVSFVAIPARAEEPREKPQLAPVSAEFEAYRQKTPGEFYGYIPPPIDLSHLKDLPVAGQAPRRQLAQPDSFDWRDSNKVTPVKDQGQAGTCWVFGTLAAVESKVLIGESVAYDFSEQNLVCCTDPSWVYLHNDRRNAGGWSWLATDTLTKKGSRLESCDPYDVGAIDEEACDDNCTTIKRVTGYRLVAPTTALVKDAVYNQGPVSMAFYWNSSYFDSETDIYSYPDCPWSPNHLVSIVGWDDNKGTSGAWIVKNSWGTGWGDSGYFYLCYDSGNMDEVAFYQYEDYDSLEKVYYWDEAGWVGNSGYDSNYAWMASVFTAEQSGTLTNVDFWATSNNAQYQIYVYNDGDPSDGLENQLTSQSGTCGEAGYYSVALASPSSLNASQQFTIAVKMTTTGYGFPIPMEYEWVVVEPTTITMCDPPIQTGVSYMRHGDTDGWYDLVGSDWNACLRAKINLATITVTAPNDITAWSLTTPTGPQPATQEGVLVVTTNGSWQATCHDAGATTTGHMTDWDGSSYNAGNKLANALKVAADTEVTLPDGGIIATGTGDRSVLVTFKQTVVWSDAPSPAEHSYRIVVTFTVTITGE